MTTLVPLHPGAASDLAMFARRVSRFEPDAVIRIVGGETVVGCFAETPFDALALRAVALAEPLDVDIVVEAGTLAARAVSAGGRLDLPAALPPLRWTTSMPPQSGWTESVRLPLDQVIARVDVGVEDFKARASGVADGLALREGRAALERLAGEIWDVELAEGMPLRLAHAASSYGFLVGDGGVVLRQAGSWWRLDAPHGAVLARGGLALFAL